MGKETETKVENEGNGRGTTPYDFFRSTAHELVTHDASYQLIQPGETIREILAKTVFFDLDDLNRVAQCIAKLEESGLGEDAEPPYDSGINMVKNILLGRVSIYGRSRGEFMQALGRLFAPSYFDLMQNGKIKGDGKAKLLGRLKKHKDETAEET